MEEILTEAELYKKTPQELTAILYHECINRLVSAKESIRKMDYIEANNHLQKCNDILIRLGKGINYEAGIIADQLEVLYNYMAERIIAANIKKEGLIIDEVLNILYMLAESWDVAITKTKELPMINNQNKKVKAYDQSKLDNKVDIKE